MTTARRAGAVSAATLSGLALTLGFAHSVAPAWVRRAGLDLWNLPALSRHLHETRDETMSLQNQQDRLLREIETSEHLAARLIEGGLTLAEATDDLAPALAARPGFEDAVRHRFKSESFRRGVAAYLIDKARQLLAADPDRWAEVSARLRAEFAGIG